MTPDNNMKKVASLYDTVAAEYAEQFSNEHEKKPMDEQALRRFAKAVGAEAPVWDLGCGPGQTARYLHDLGVSISGLDLSEKILEQARAHHPMIPFKVGNVLKLGFEDASIAGIVSFYAIVHLSKKQVKTALSEFHRVLKPGAPLLLTYHIGEESLHVDEFLGKKVDIDFMFFTTGFIKSSIEEMNFSNIEIIEREPYPGVEYESRRAYAFAQKADHSG